MVQNYKSWVFVQEIVSQTSCVNQQYELTINRNQITWKSKTKLFSFPAENVIYLLSLQKTDITQPTLEALAESQVRRVLIVGRRGPIQIACTIKVCVGKKRQQEERIICSLVPLPQITINRQTTSSKTCFLTPQTRRYY